MGWTLYPTKHTHNTHPNIHRKYFQFKKRVVPTDRFSPLQTGKAISHKGTLPPGYTSTGLCLIYRGIYWQWTSYIFFIHIHIPLFRWFSLVLCPTSIILHLFASHYFFFHCSIGHYSQRRVYTFIHIYRKLYVFFYWRIIITTRMAHKLTPQTINQAVEIHRSCIPTS